MAPEYNTQWLRPLVQGWKEKKQASEKARKNWLDVAKECRRFYAGPVGWIWEGEHKRRFWKDAPTPTFQMTINKAFEFVAIYLPFLWSNIPHRQVTPKRTLNFDPALLLGPPPQPPPQLQMMMQQLQQQAQQGGQQQPGQPPNPQAQQAQMQLQQIQQQLQQQKMQYDTQLQQLQQQQKMESTQDDTRADLLQRWLNYTTKEMPAGGLERHGELACLDMLITGRGVLWPVPYRMPGSKRTLTGCFYRPVYQFYTDPDVDDWEDGTFVMRETTEPCWKVERRFGLPEGSLRNRGSMESSWSRSERAADYRNRALQDTGKTKDMLTYTEVWSKGGPGSRYTTMEPSYKELLEKTVGDYAYLAFSNDIPWPLNAPEMRFREGATEEEVKEMFRWPVEYWSDGRWPCVVLDCYHDIPLKDEQEEDKTKFRGWPIAPMGPGLGELKFINAAMSFLTGRLVSSCRDFWAVMAQAYPELVDALESGKDQSVIKVNKLHGKITDVMSIIQQPETRQDVWRIIDAVLVMLDKRWHLNSLMYGMSGPTQERSATEIVEKRQAMQIVPEFMAKKVENTHTHAAIQEALCTALFVKAQDVEPMFGKVGSMLWQQLIENQDPEVVIRQMKYTIGAGTIRRKNRDKEAADINSMMQAYGGLMQEYFKMTGDPGPVNATIKAHGDVNDRDMSEMFLKPPPPPQPDPAEQQRQQLEAQKMQAEIQGKQMELQGKQMEMQGKQAETQMDLQAKQAEMAMKQQEVQFKLATDQNKMQLDRAAATMDLKQDAASHRMDMAQDQAKHLQELIQDEAKHDQEMEQLEQMSSAKVSAVKAQARAKPKTSGSNGEKK